MPLTKRTGAVTVEPHHLCQRRNAVGYLPGVARKRRGGLHDRTGIGGVMVTAGFQRITCR